MNIFKSTKPIRTEEERCLKLEVEVKLSRSIGGGWSGSEKDLVVIKVNETLNNTSDAKTKDLKGEIENILADVVNRFEKKFKDCPDLTDQYHANLKKQKEENN